MFISCQPLHYYRPPLCPPHALSPLLVRHNLVILTKVCSNTPTSSALRLKSLRFYFYSATLCYSKKLKSSFEAFTPPIVHHVFEILMISSMDEILVPHHCCRRKPDIPGARRCDLTLDEHGPTHPKPHELTGAFTFQDFLYESYIARGPAPATV